MSTTASLRSALAGFAGVKRRFTRTGEAGGITVIDDYGHHPVEIAAVLKAARAGWRQARRDRGGAAASLFAPRRDLFEEFCTCFNDADTVIVADVYAAGEAADRGHRQGRAGGRAARARASLACVPLPAPDSLAELINAIAQARRLCGVPRRGQHHRLGACAAGTAGGVAVALARPPRRGDDVMMAAAMRIDAAAQRPAGAGRAARARAARCRARPVHLVPRRRPGRWLFRPADPDDLLALLRNLPDAVPLTVIGVGVQPDRARRRDRRAWWCAWRAASATSSVDADGIVAGAAALDVTVAATAASHGLAGLEFLVRHSRHHRRRRAMNAGAYGTRGEGRAGLGGGRRRPQAPAAPDRR